MRVYAIEGLEINKMMVPRGPIGLFVESSWGSS